MWTPAAEKEVFESQENEMLLKENPSRWVILPIQYDDIWAAFKRLEESFWTPEDVTYLKDAEKLRTLPLDALRMLQQLAAFNQICYRRVYDVEGVTRDLFCTVQSPEARSFYTFQLAFETFHIEVYAQILETLTNYNGAKEDEAISLCKAVYQFDSVKGKKEWVRRYMEGEKPYVQKLLASVIIKQLFSCSNMIIRGWMEEQKIDLPGTAGGLRLVAKDLWLHAEFCSLLYNTYFDRKLNSEDVKAMITEAVKCEIEFLKEFVPSDIVRTEESTLEEFVFWMADEILEEMKMEKMFQIKKCPLSNVDIGKDKIPKGDHRGSVRRTAKDQMNLLEEWRSGVQRGMTGEAHAVVKQNVFSVDEDF